MNAKNCSIIALVCGLVGLVGSFFIGTSYLVGFICLACSIIGIIFGSKGMKLSKEAGESSGLAIAGLVLGIVGTVFSVVGIICAAACNTAIDAIDETGKELENALEDAVKELESEV